MSATATPEDVMVGRARWCVVEGDALLMLRSFDPCSVGVGIHDPPYSEHVHSKQRRMLRGAGGRAAKGQRSGRGQVGPAPLGFNAITAAQRQEAAEHFARVTRRWTLVFSDVESNHLWREHLSRNGAEHVRVGAWLKLCGQPQLSGDRPAVGFEAVEVAHPPGRKRWNGGGHPARWAHQIATDRNASGARLHTTQKPISLMLELVEQFTDPGEMVLDAFCGSATTGAACLQLGRRFIGIEIDPAMAEVARTRLAREEAAGLRAQLSLLVP